MHFDDLLHERIVFDWLTRREGATIQDALREQKLAIIGSVKDASAALEGALSAMYAAADARMPWLRLINPNSPEGRHETVLLSRKKWEARYKMALSDPETQRKLDEYAARHSAKGTTL